MWEQFMSCFKKAGGKGCNPVKLTELLKRVPPNQIRQYKVFLKKNELYKARVHKYPAQLPTIDWNYYKLNVRPEYVSWVKDFQIKYERLGDVFNERHTMIDQAKYFAEVEKERKEVKRQIAKYKEESNQRIKCLEAQRDHLKNMLPYEEMTMEEFSIAHPDIAPDFINRPTFWPHTPEEQMPGPMGGHRPDDDGPHADGTKPGEQKPPVGTPPANAPPAGAPPAGAPPAAPPPPGAPPANPMTPQPKPSVPPSPTSAPAPATSPKPEVTPTPAATPTPAPPQPTAPQTPGAVGPKPTTVDDPNKKTAAASNVCIKLTDEAKSSQDSKVAKATENEAVVKMEAMAADLMVKIIEAIKFVMAEAKKLLCLGVQKFNAKRKEVEAAANAAREQNAKEEAERRKRISSVASPRQRRPMTDTEEDSIHLREGSSDICHKTIIRGDEAAKADVKPKHEHLDIESLPCDQQQHKEKKAKSKAGDDEYNESPPCGKRQHKETKADEDEYDIGKDNEADIKCALAKAEESKNKECLFEKEWESKPEVKCAEAKHKVSEHGVQKHEVCKTRKTEEETKECLTPHREEPTLKQGDSICKPEEEAKECITLLRGKPKPKQEESVCKPEEETKECISLLRGKPKPRQEESVCKPEDKTKESRSPLRGKPKAKIEDLVCKPQEETKECHSPIRGKPKPKEEELVCKPEEETKECQRSLRGMSKPKRGKSVGKSEGEGRKCLTLLRGRPRSHQEESVCGPEDETKESRSPLRGKPKVKIEDLVCKPQEETKKCRTLIRGRPKTKRNDESDCASVLRKHDDDCEKANESIELKSTEPVFVSVESYKFNKKDKRQSKPRSSARAKPFKPAGNKKCPTESDDPTALLTTQTNDALNDPMIGNLQILETSEKDTSKLDLSPKKMSTDASKEPKETDSATEQSSADNTTTNKHPDSEECEPVYVSTVVPQHRADDKKLLEGRRSIIAKGMPSKPVDMTDVIKGPGLALVEKTSEESTKDLLIDVSEPHTKMPTLKTKVSKEDPLAHQDLGILKRSRDSIKTDIVEQPPEDKRKKFEIPLLEDKIQVIDDKLQAIEDFYAEPPQSNMSGRGECPNEAANRIFSMATDAATLLSEATKTIEEAKEKSSEKIEVLESVYMAAQHQADRALLEAHKAVEAARKLTNRAKKSRNEKDKEALILAEKHALLAKMLARRALNLKREIAKMLQDMKKA